MGRKRLNRGYSFKLYRGVSNNGLTVSLVLRINGQRIIKSFPFAATIEQWDETTQRYIDDDLARNIIREKKLQGEERKSFLAQLHPDRKANNAFLHKTTGQLNHIIDDFEVRKIPYTANMIIEKLFVSVKSSSVEKFLLSEIEDLKGSNRFGTARTYEDLHKSLSKYDPNLGKKLFPDIDYNYVFNFFQNQIALGREKGGIAVNLRALRSLLNDAIKANMGSPETYPFSNQYGTRTGQDTFSISTMTKNVTRKRYIPKELLLKFYNFEFQSIPHRRTKHLFFFSFFAGGMNFADMMTLRESDIKMGYNSDQEEIRYFTYYRKKTKEPIEIQINNDIQTEINRLRDPEFGVPADNFLLPIVTKTNLSPEELERFKINKRKKFNKYLKEMAELMDFPEGIDDISSYFARHSFAMQLFSKTGSIDAVSAGLHHAKIETTKIYLESIKMDEVAKMTEGLLND